MPSKKSSVYADPRDLIKDHLEEIERDWAWLARKTDIPYATIYSCFVLRHFNLSDNNRSVINEILGTDF